MVAHVGRAGPAGVVTRARADVAVGGEVRPEVDVLGLREAQERRHDDRRGRVGRQGRLGRERRAEQQRRGEDAGGDSSIVHAKMRHRWRTNDTRERSSGRVAAITAS